MPCSVQRNNPVCEPRVKVPLPHPPLVVGLPAQQVNQASQANRIKRIKRITRNNGSETVATPRPRDCKNHLRGGVLDAWPSVGRSQSLARTLAPSWRPAGPRSKLSCQAARLAEACIAPRLLRRVNATLRIPRRLLRKLIPLARSEPPKAFRTGLLDGFAPCRLTSAISPCAAPSCLSTS